MVVVQSMILLGSESWVVTPKILQFLGSLQNRVAQRIYVRMPWYCNRHWEYPPIGEVLAESGMELIGEYISRRHTGVAQ